MRLNKDIELVDGLPIAYIKSLKAIVISDMHLGYEGVIAKRQGILMPKVNLKKIIKELTQAVGTLEVEQIIVTGDIKNEFSGVDTEEFNELYDFIKFAKQHSIKLVLIKGNHDNFVDRYKASFNIEVHQEQAQINGYLFFHGDELPTINKDTKMLIMGHEHPSIGVYSAVRTKQKLRCFLYASYKKLPLIVLPAISYFAAGTELNIRDSSNLLSPVLKKIDLDKAKAIVIGHGETMDFGTIRKLRAHASA